MVKSKFSVVVGFVLLLTLGLVWILVNIAGAGASKSTNNQNVMGVSDTAVESLTSISAIAATNSAVIEQAKQKTIELEQQTKKMQSETNNAINGVANQVSSMTSELQTQIANLTKQLSDLKTKEKQLDVGQEETGVGNLVWIEPTYKTSNFNQPLYGGEGNFIDNIKSKGKGLISNIDVSLSSGNNTYNQTSLQNPESIIPVYTIPRNSTLTGVTSMTSLIGRVPIGTNVRFPVRFKLITGANNLISNSMELGGIKEAVWSGYAIGDRVLECVRGVIDSVTFTFNDGRIVSIPNGATRASSSSQNFDENSGIGWISDPYGNCIKGKYITNAPENLLKLFKAGFAEGASSAAASSQVRLNGNGLSSTLTGNALEFAAGIGASNGLSEWSNYIAERAREDFDVIYVQSGKQIVINITNPVHIDYDFGGRKLDYFSQEVIQNDLR